MRIQLRQALWEFFHPFKALKDIFSSKGEPGVGGPEQVGTAQILVPVRLGNARILRIEKWNQNNFIVVSFHPDPIFLTPHVIHSPVDGKVIIIPYVSGLKHGYWRAA
jgi:hypothetical protein